MTALPRPGWEARSIAEWRTRLGVPELEIHPEVPSTNDRVRELARDGHPPFSVVVAESQSAGRGRGGKSWISPRGGGLWISVLLPEPPGGPPGVASLAVGVSAALAVECAAPGTRVALKWPNDLLVLADEGAHRKLGGILCEAVHTSQGGMVVAGVGINLHRQAASNSELPLEELGRAAYLDEIHSDVTSAAELAIHLVSELRRWADPPPDRLEGPLRREWELRDMLAGKRVRLELGPVGRALGVASDGSLRIATLDGTLRSVSGGGVRLDDGPDPHDGDLIPNVEG